MLIREATESDWPAIWPFFHEIVAAADTYCYDPDLTEAAGRAMWLPGPPARTVVAVDDAGAVMGSARVGRNQQGGGSHIAGGSFMVDPRYAGRGVGRALVEHALDWARASGFRGMQFNAVVESNERAVQLWQSVGFDIIATVPGGFLHPSKGYVGLHIMYRSLL